jgi:crotonobetainyl-CoA:carnitine CoA-transferase CaiB-like acyl-CoA transferase
VSFRPLAGIRVLDLCRLYPGALATAKLADLGAEVVKVEEPTRGDYLRTIPPVVEGRGILHLLCDRGKASVALDVRDPADRSRFERLLDAADVVVEASRPGALAEMGVDFGELRRARPHLVLCSLTGFGQDGPLAQVPSHGMNMDALAGVTFLEDCDGRPALATRGFSLGVELGAVNAALAMAAAVHHARATGEGVWIDVSCWDAAVDATRMPIATLLEAPEQRRTSGRPPLYDVYAGSDGGLVLFCAIERKFWLRFCEEVGRSDLAEAWSGVDVDFGAADLRGELEAVFATEPAAWWSERFQEWGIPGSAILDLEGVVTHPHFAARGMIERDPGQPLLRVANPIRWHDRDERAGSGLPPAPELGADTEAVLDRWVGLVDTEEDSHP